METVRDIHRRFSMLSDFMFDVLLDFLKLADNEAYFCVKEYQQWPILQIQGVFI